MRLNATHYDMAVCRFTHLRPIAFGGGANVHRPRTILIFRLPEQRKLVGARRVIAELQIWIFEEIL
jgi:hypothetical protein